jgi:hypothetical protein
VFFFKMLRCCFRFTIKWWHVLKTCLNSEELIWIKNCYQTKMRTQMQWKIIAREYSVIILLSLERKISFQISKKMLVLYHYHRFSTCKW